MTPCTTCMVSCSTSLSRFPILLSHNISPFSYHALMWLATCPLPPSLHSYQIRACGYSIYKHTLVLPLPSTPSLLPFLLLLPSLLPSLLPPLPSLLLSLLPPLTLSFSSCLTQGQKGLPGPIGRPGWPGDDVGLTH